MRRLPLAFALSPSRTFDVPTKVATNRVVGRVYSWRGVSTCSMRPLLKTATRSDIDSASPWSCVT